MSSFEGTYLALMEDGDGALVRMAFDALRLREADYTQGILILDRLSLQNHFYSGNTYSCVEY